MANKNMTRIEALDIAIACVDDVQALAVLTRMKEQLSKPKTSVKQETAAHKSNVAEAKKLYEVATADLFDWKYITEHTSAMTSQKAVGIMKVGIEELGLFEKVMDGKKVKYRKL